MKLLIKQTQALDLLEDNVTEEVYYGGAAGGGKTQLGCYWLAKSSLKYPGSRWLMGRSELKNVKRTTLVSFFDVAKQQGLIAGTHFNYNQQDSVIRFYNGSEIILADLFAYPSDPNFDSLGSLEITGAFIDESPQVTEKAKNIVKSRIRYKLNEFSLMPKMLMTGNPSKGWPYETFYKPYRDGAELPHRRFIQALPGDNPHLPQAYINNLKNLDKNSRERLLYGNWEYDSDPSALIDYDKIMDCFTSQFIEGGGKFITADIARFGSDKTVIGVWDGYRVKLFHFHGLDVTESAAKIRELQAKYGVSNSNTIADEDGVGGGVVDILGCAGFVNNSRPLPNPITREPENYANLKSQCYFALAKRINNGEVYIDCQDIEVKKLIIEELEYVKQYNMDKDGKKQVLPKDKIKEQLGRSPDFADTLMMREWFSLKPKRSWVAF